MRHLGRRLLSGAQGLSPTAAARIRPSLHPHAPRCTSPSVDLVRWCSSSTASGQGSPQYFSSLPKLYAARPVGENVRLSGWVRTTRRQKKFTFFELTDGMSAKTLQVVVDSERTPEDLSTGASVDITGCVQSHPKDPSKIELSATAVHIVGSSPYDYPLQKKKHSLEFLRSIPHLRSRSRTLGAVTRVRGALAGAIRRYFESQSFLEVHTPVLTTNDCEGGAALFRVFPNETEGVEQDFFGKPTFLTVSGQLQAEALALAHSRVYTFGPTFRAENSNTTRHLAEFWMLEPELVNATINDAIDVAEGCLRSVFAEVRESCSEDLQTLGAWPEGLPSSLVEDTYERITYTEAVEIIQKSGKTFEHEVQWGDDLSKEHETFLVEEAFPMRPVFVTHYPAEIKPFYMRLSDGFEALSPEKRTVDAFDLLIPGVGEMIGGSAREDRFEMLRDRMLRLGLITCQGDAEDYESIQGPLKWYLDLRRYGSVPHAGWGLGFERLISFTTGMSNVRDVIMAPRAPGLCDL